MTQTHKSEAPSCRMQRPLENGSQGSRCSITASKQKRARAVAISAFAGPPTVTYPPPLPKPGSERLRAMSAGMQVFKRWMGLYNTLIRTQLKVSMGCT